MCSTQANLQYPDKNPPKDFTLYISPFSPLHPQFMETSPENSLASNNGVQGVCVCDVLVHN